ncbi:hypothetical protein ABI59_11335 [Acidobacteria bacterium Mor1]|nr:hypothetical protein ABI59_11335 [Acidobacteria bacterium Mor1]
MLVRRLSIFCVLLALAAVPAAAGSDFNIIYGTKSMDDDFAPFDSQQSLMASLTLGDDNWPVYLAVDFLLSDDDSMDGSTVFTEGSTRELAFGARKVWDHSRVRPFVGGGITRIEGEFRRENLIVDDAALGFWLDAGVFWRIGDSFNLGIEGRMSRAKVEIGPDGSEVEAGGESVGLLVGFGW